MTTSAERYYAAQAADDAWQAELNRIFRKEAGTVRYTKAGRGEPGSRLRELHDRFVETRDAWRQAMESDRLQGVPSFLPVA